MVDFWRTWNNKTIPFNELDHQHLSNIHYFMNLVHPAFYPKWLKEGIRNRLIIEFGKILPYRPDPKFTEEKNYLRKLGFLKENNDIVVHGLKIGFYG